MTGKLLSSVKSRTVREVSFNSRLLNVSSVRGLLTSGGAVNSCKSSGGLIVSDETRYMLMFTVPCGPTSKKQLGQSKSNSITDATET